MVQYTRRASITAGMLPVSSLYSLSQYLLILDARTRREMSHKTTQTHVANNSVEPVSSTVEASFTSTSVDLSSPSQPIATVPSALPDPHDSLQSILHRKHKEWSSPCSSPLKLTRPPLAKKHRRARTFAEAAQKSSGWQDPPKVFHRHPRSSHAYPQHKLLYSSFLPNVLKKALRNANGKIFAYIMHKETDTTDKVLVNLKTYFGIQSQCTPTVEQSNVVYLSAVDMHADST